MRYCWKTGWPPLELLKVLLSNVSMANLWKICYMLDACSHVRDCEEIDVPGGKYLFQLGFCIRSSIPSAFELHALLREFDFLHTCSVSVGLSDGVVLHPWLGTMDSRSQARQAG